MKYKLVREIFEATVVVGELKETSCIDAETIKEFDTLEEARIELMSTSYIIDIRPTYMRNTYHIDRYIIEWIDEDEQPQFEEREDFIEIITLSQGLK